MVFDITKEVAALRALQYYAFQTDGGRRARDTIEKIWEKEYVTMAVNVSGKRKELEAVKAIATRGLRACAAFEWLTEYGSGNIDNLENISFRMAYGAAASGNKEAEEYLKESARKFAKAILDDAIAAAARDISATEKPV